MKMAAKQTETAACLFARLGKRQTLDGLDDVFFDAKPNGLSPGDTIELYGEEGSGKTELLLHFCVKCILPKRWDSVHFNGKETKVIYIDTDYNFPIWRIVKILENQLKDAYRNCERNLIGNSNTNEFIKSCLGRLFVLKCHSSYNLSKTISSIESLLAAHPDTCLVLIDRISSFYWTDRTIGGANRTSQESNQREIIAKLKKLQRVYHIVVIAIKSAIMKPSENAVSNSVKNTRGGTLSWRHDSYMSVEWTKFVKYRYLTQRNDSGDVFSAVLLDDPSKKEHCFTISNSGIKLFQV